MTTAKRAPSPFSRLPFLLCLAVLLASPVALHADARGVIWKDKVNSIAIGNSLIKSAGCITCEDAGAVSRQEIYEGDGYIEFTVTGPNEFFYAGLNHADHSTSAADIDFAFRIFRNIAEVREQGEYRIDVPVVPGDVFSIRIEEGLANYYRNDEHLFTSDLMPSYPLMFDTSLVSHRAEVSNARIATSNEVRWTQLRNAHASASTLIKTGGCSGCPDAGAHSAQRINSGDGFVEFTMSTTSNYYAGLSSNPQGDSVEDIDFGLWLHDGVAEIREAGFYRGEVPASSGDVFRIEIGMDLVTYYQNDEFFYSTAVAPHYPLSLATILMEPGTLLASARMGDIQYTAAEMDDGPLLPDDEAREKLLRRTGLVSCGRNDANIYAPLDYEDFLPPAPGSSYLDPSFGCIITRLSDGRDRFNTGHQYSSISPFNSDNSLILVQTGDGYHYLINRSGQVVVSPEELNISDGAEPVWSPGEPNVFYYHQPRGNQAFYYDVASRSRGHLHTFSDYSRISFGGGEGDLSEDGDHIVVIGDGRYVHVVQGSTGIVSKALDTGGHPFDWFDMTADNNVLALWDAQGDERYQGLELYDRNMNFIRQVAPFNGHADRGRDINGDEIVVMVASNDANPAIGCSGNGVVKIRLADSKKTCLMRLYWGESSHVSINNSDGHPWVLVSSTEYFLGSAAPASLLAEDWADSWGAFYNELNLVKLDGSEIHRLAHHRSRTQDGYTHQPKASLSRDGRFVLFDSNYAQPGSNYVDVYLIDTRR